MALVAPRDRLIVALDMPEAAAAERMVEQLGDSVTFYKVGLELLFAGGLGVASVLRAHGKSVFLDMKLLDISNTVEKAVANIAGLGFQFLTIHGHDVKTMRAADRGRQGSDLKLLAVTVLTHLDDADLAQQTSTLTAGDLVVHRARLAREAGIDGVISSGLEAERVRAATGAGFLIVTPGIRLADGLADDQTRIATPASSIASGADYLVVGRPITTATDPKAVAGRFVAEIASSRPAER